MSESLPFVETLVAAIDCDPESELPYPSPREVRAALHALIAHCRQQPLLRWDGNCGVQGAVGPVCHNHSEPPKSSPAPASASASARAEAMERLRMAVNALPVLRDGYTSNLAWAAEALLALPEPDECAGLRDLLGFIERLPGYATPQGAAIQRHEVRDEIRRRLAAGGAS